MVENIGLIELNIIRLKRISRILRERQNMSSAYPVHKINLTEQCLQLQTELKKLVQNHTNLLKQSSQLQSQLEKLAKNRKDVLLLRSK